MAEQTESVVNLFAGTKPQQKREERAPNAEDNQFVIVKSELVEAPFYVPPDSDDRLLEVASDSYAVFMHFTARVSALMAAGLTDQVVE